MTLLLSFLLLGVTLAGAQEPNRAALVVRLGEDQVETRCVTFEEPTISGYDLLLAANLDAEIEVSGLGTKVCRIEGTGCPSDDCWCQCQGNPCVYWSYWSLEEGEWRYSAAGAASYEVEPGDVQGWSWGPGSVTEAIPPPLLTFADICGAAGQEVATVGAEAGAAEAGAVAADEAPLNLLLYALFGIIVLLLLAGLWWAQRRPAGGEE